MCPEVPPRRLFKCLAILTALAAMLGSPALTQAAQFPANPVDALRDSLTFRSGEDKSPIALEHRKETLAKRVAALKTMAELTSALMLEEWKDANGAAAISPALAAIDRAARSQVAKRLTTAVREVVQQGDGVRRLALAHYLGAVGSQVRSVDQAPHGFFRTLAPELIALCKDKDGEVREAAAQALGKVLPELAPALAALGQMLKKDGVAQRQAAAQGLVNLIQTTAELQKKGNSQTGIWVSADDVVGAVREVIPAAGEGLTDPSLGVRRVCLVAMQRAAAALSDLIPDPFPDGQFPTGRALSNVEAEHFQYLFKRLAVDHALFLPVFKALHVQVPALDKTIGDNDAAVRQTACQALESVAQARRRFLHMPGKLTQIVKDPKWVLPEDDVLNEALRATVPALAKRLADKDSDVQLAALYALEAMESLASQAAEPLMKVLQSTDSFVRWGAVRALGRMAPLSADGPLAAQVTLALGKRLTDDNGDVRATTMLALQRYGAAAKPAVQALAEAVNRGQAEERILAMRTIVAIGPEAQGAISALIAALGNEEAQVRSTAARALGRFGPAAVGATEALTKRLNDADADADAEVRQAVAEALLLVTAQEK